MEEPPGRMLVAIDEAPLFGRFRARDDEANGLVRVGLQEAINTRASQLHDRWRTALVKPVLKRRRTISRKDEARHPLERLVSGGVTRRPQNDS